MTTSCLLICVLTLPALSLAITCGSLDLSNSVFKQKVRAVDMWSEENMEAVCDLEVIFYSPSHPVKATKISIGPQENSTASELECEGSNFTAEGNPIELTDWLDSADEPLNVTYFCILSGPMCANKTNKQNKKFVEEFGPLPDEENENRSASFVCQSGIPRRELLFFTCAVAFFLLFLFSP